MARQDNPDIIVVGAGHNTLVAAAYLARAGLGVLVLERNAVAGGGAVSKEVTLPGFVHDLHATGAAHLQTHPLVTHDELDLIGKYGLKFVYPTASFMSVFDDGDTLACYQDLDRTCDEIGRYSARDAQSYRRMVKFMEGVLPLVGMSMVRPPASFGAFLAMIERTPFGNELILAMFKSAYDVVVELFEHPKVRMHFLKWAGETLCGPEDKTTGVNMLFLIGGSHSKPPGAIVGGTQNLTRATLRALEAHAGEVRLNTPVKRVINTGGEAKAVELADGRIVRARKAVIAGIHPHLLGDTVEGLDPGLIERARRTQVSPYGEMLVHAALKERPVFQAGDLPDCLNYNLMDYATCGGIDGFRRAFDDMKYGLLPKPLIASVVLHTVYDPSRAPDGRHTLYLNSFAPYRLAGRSGWGEAKEERADWLMRELGRFASGFEPANVLGRCVDSPEDMVRHSPSFQGGDIMGLGSYIYQSLGLRPTADLAHYRVPGAKGLYLAGPFMHPGGGLTGGGRAVAMRVMEDLGVKSNQVFRV